MLLNRKKAGPRLQKKNELHYESTPRLLGQHPMAYPEVDGNGRVVLKDYTVVKFAKSEVDDTGKITFSLN